MKSEFDKEFAELMEWDRIEMRRIDDLNIPGLDSQESRNHSIEFKRRFNDFLAREQASKVTS
jgi:hypothetical protein